MRTILASLVLMACLQSLHAEYKAEPISKPAPESTAVAIRQVMANSGWQVLADDGKPVLRVWLRSEIAGSTKPAGPKGNVLFPFLTEGELLGVVEVVSQVGDYRDQPIAPGVYTFRYGIQPVNGDHLGASPFRDFGCLIPAKKDQKPEPLTKKSLEHDSAEAAGTSHPAIMMLLAPEEGTKAGSMVRDDANDRNSVIIPISVKHGDGVTPVLIQWVVSGRAPV